MTQPQHCPECGAAWSEGQTCADHDITYNLYAALARSVVFFDVWVKRLQ